MHCSPERDERIFADALARPPSERSDFLTEACEGDLDLKRRIDALLEASDSAEGFLEVPPRILGTHYDGNVPISPLSNETLERINCYRLLQKLGEGGCGVVYLAEQLEPVRRRVALKVIKLGMDTKAVIARFEAERQALAMMDHPNIARVLDAGATENGRPFFAMELVRGIKITDFCDQNLFTTAKRLELFCRVCSAVQHAHLKGIIHRDLKPSNILVSVHEGVPVPKVIDFGISKATQGRLTDRTLFTAFEQFIGTPAYMSPEQAEMSGLDVDTRSDIYSLGVLLYELLAGRQPFEARILREAGIDEVRRIIRDVEPPKPSIRLRDLPKEDLCTLAKSRQIEGPKLVGQVNGDIDWIVMKALEKDRVRRYETASALAADIICHLEHKPVLARPPSFLYSLQKLVRRNRLAFCAALVTAVLIGGLGVATWSLTQEKAARQRAVLAESEQNLARMEAEAARVREAQQRAAAELREEQAKVAAARSEQAFTFIAGLLKGVGPGLDTGPETALLREDLDRSVNRLDAASQYQPEIQANLRFIFGMVFVDMGEYARAEAMVREALIYTRKAPSAEDGEVAGALILLGKIQQLRGRGSESEPLLREALALARRFPGAQEENLAEALFTLGNSLLGQGKLSEAEACCREAFELVQTHPDIEYLPPDMVQMILAAVLQEEGRMAEAEPIFNAALAAQKNRKSLGQDHPMVVFARSGLSNLLMMQSKLPEAVYQFREALSTLRKSHSHEYPTIIMVLFNLAYIAHQSGKLADAEIQYREVLALQQKVFGQEHPATLQTQSLLGQVVGTPISAAPTPTELPTEALRNFPSNPSSLPSQ